MLLLLINLLNSIVVSAIYIWMKLIDGLHSTILISVRLSSHSLSTHRCPCPSPPGWMGDCPPVPWTICCSLTHSPRDEAIFYCSTYDRKVPPLLFIVIVSICSLLPSCLLRVNNQRSNRGVTRPVPDLIG